MVLGLEAKIPEIILPDVIALLTIKECISGTRLTTDSDVPSLKYFLCTKMDEFNTRFAKVVDALTGGFTGRWSIFLTQLPEPSKPNYVQSLINDAKAKGAKVLNKKGGQLTHNYSYPAVLYPVTSEMDVSRRIQWLQWCLL